MSRKTTGLSRPRWGAQFLAILFVACFAVLAACGGGGNNKQKNPVPVLTSVSPASAAAGSGAFALTVNGSGFVSGSTVTWNGSSRTTTFVSAAQLTAAIAAADVASAGTAQIAVTNPTPGGGVSSALVFTITNSVPTVSSLSPEKTVAGSPAFDLTVNGSGFVNGTTVQWNGTARPTTFVGSSVLKAAIAAADVASAGTAQVRVVNPAPGGGTSAVLVFTIQNPAPVLASLGPPGVQAGNPAFDLTVTGSGFVPGATVLWGGATRATTFVSATQVRAAIAATDVAAAAIVNVAVRNPEPTVGPSNALQFAITNPPNPPRPLYPLYITVAPDGSPPNGPSINGGQDMAGRYVVFASKASNLVPGDTNGAWDVFVRDTCIDMWGVLINGCTPSTTRISVAPDGSQANGDSGSTATSPDRGLAVSFDGRYVAFVSSASNLVAGDTNGVDDVFVSSTCLGAGGNCNPQTVRVSLGADGSQSSSPASAPAIGEDPGRVLFVSSDGGLVAGDANGVADVFMRVVCFQGTSGCTPTTRRISTAQGGGDANGASGTPVFTGRYVAFMSAASNLVAGDTNGVVDVFMRDTCVGEPGGCADSIERISVASDGAQANGASSDPVVGMPESSWDGFDYHGRFVVFVSTATNLVTGDTNGVADVFMRDTCRGRPGCVPSTKRISVTSTGAQIIGKPSLQPGHMRWDGEVVLFVTAADGVVPEDANGLADVYSVVVCHDKSDCTDTSSWVSMGTGGVVGNGASYSPRGNYDAWVGPEYATFVTEATNLVPGGTQAATYGTIVMTRVY